MLIGLHHYLIVAAILFTIGVFGIFVNRKNVIIILMCVESTSWPSQRIWNLLLGLTRLRGKSLRYLF